MEREKSIPELDKLFQDVGTYRSSKDFKALVDFIKKFPKIAAYNAMLIHVQKPGSTYVASARDWDTRFRRWIKAGARPLVILRAFGPVSFVFDLSDTDGSSPFPDELLNPFRVSGKISERNFRLLTSNLIKDGIQYCEADFGTTQAGFIRTAVRDMTFNLVEPRGTTGLKILYEMVVNRNHADETKFATILHELGHLYCGHLGTPYTKWWADRRSNDINAIEFEAECVCWLICERLGIDNPSAEYLSHYLNDNDCIPDISMDAVLKAVNTIEGLLCSPKKPRKEIVLWKDDKR